MGFCLLFQIYREGSTIFQNARSEPRAGAGVTPWTTETGEEASINWVKLLVNSD